MGSSKAYVRRKEAGRRRTDAVREALRRRGQNPAESLRALSALNEAVRRLNRARR